MKTVVGRRGRVTIPKPLRDSFGIRPGMALEFIAKDGALVARKTEPGPVTQVFGCLGRRIDTDNFILALRGTSSN